MPCTVPVDPGDRTVRAMNRHSEIHPDLTRPMLAVGVIGAGVVGGSVALAAHRAGLDVVVYDSDPGTIAAARAAGLSVAATPAEACVGRDLVVLATPVDEMMVVAPMIRPYLEPDTVVTEVGSVKAPVRGLVEALSSPRVSVVPSHPMAGSERFGFANAAADLLDGCTWLLCSDENDPAATRLAAFVAAIGGGRTLRCALDAHDIVVAVVSHLPQLAASILAAAVGAAEENYANGAFAAAGGGFRDSTRIADSSLVMWLPVIEANRAMLATLLEDLAGRAAATAAALRRNDMDAISELFADAHAARDKWRAALPAPAPVPTPPPPPPVTWRDESGAVAWIDGSLGWETVRTDVTDPLAHAEVVARFLAKELALPAVPVITEQGANHKRVAAALVAAGADVTTRETWTADGLHVGGVQAADRFFVIA
jgi:prephenate dehydrogenase